MEWALSFVRMSTPLLLKSNNRKGYSDEYKMRSFAPEGRGRKPFVSRRFILLAVAERLSYVPSMPRSRCHTDIRSERILQVIL